MVQYLLRILSLLAFYGLIMITFAAQYATRPTNRRYKRPQRNEFF